MTSQSETCFGKSLVTDQLTISLYFLSAGHNAMSDAKTHSPVHTMKVSLDIVAAIVDQENDWGELMVDHGRKFLDTELPAE